MDAALERVGLADAADRRYRGYSLGMKQRLGLAAALLLPRRLVVLDEPTNGLDPAGTRDVRRIIAELHADRRHGDRLLAPAGRGGGHLHARRRAAGRARWSPPASCARCWTPGAAGLVSPPRTSTWRCASLRDAGATAYRAERRPERRSWSATTGRRRRRSIALLVRAGVAVHEARRSRANLEELFARLTEEPA